MNAAISKSGCGRVTSVKETMISRLRTYRSSRTNRDHERHGRRSNSWRSLRREAYPPGVRYAASRFSREKDETGQQYVYDAWNRMVQVKDAGGTLLLTHQYDGLNRRIMQNSQKFYYSKDWQILQDESTVTLRQYVWSLAYVDAMVLRDFNQDGSMSTGDLGKTGSGLDLRMYPMQDANWNVHRQGGVSK